MIRATKTILRFVDAFLTANETELERIWLDVSEKPKLAEKLKRIEADLVDQIEAGADIWK